MYSQELLTQQLAELNAAWHDCAAKAYGYPITVMQEAVDRLDRAQDWFKDRNIKLDYDGETGDHSLAQEQPEWRSPASKLPSYGERLQKLERMRCRHNY